MTGILTAFKFNLSNEVILHHEGKAIKIDHLLLNAPSLKQANIASRLKQLIVRGVTSAKTEQSETNNKNASSSNPTGEEILFVIMSSDIDFVEIIDAFKKLLCCGVCKVNSEIIPKDIPEEILIEDIEKMLGEYISKFFLRYLLNKLK